MRLECVACHKRMTLLESSGEGDTGTNIVFECERCASRVSLHINPAEAKLVGAMGINLGEESKSALSVARSVLGLKVAVGQRSVDEHPAVQWTDEGAEALAEAGYSDDPEVVVRAETIARDSSRSHVTAHTVHRALRELHASHSGGEGGQTQ